MCFSRINFGRTNLSRLVDDNSGKSSLDQIEKILEFTGIPPKEAIDKLGHSSAGVFLSDLKIKKRPFKSYFKECDQEIQEMILRMLEFDHTKRVKAEELMEFPCFK